MNDDNAVSLRHLVTVPFDLRRQHGIARKLIARKQRIEMFFVQIVKHDLVAMVSQHPRTGHRDGVVETGLVGVRDNQQDFQCIHAVHFLVGYPQGV
jgi:hypothetical protein